MENDFLTPEQRAGIEAAKTTHGNLQKVIDDGRGNIDIKNLAPGADISTIGKTPSSSATGTPSPYYSRYTKGEQTAANYLDTTFTPPETETQIVARKEKEAQAQIDNLNRLYDNIYAEQQTINQGRDRSTNAISVLTGLAGSSEANVASNATTNLNQRDNQKIQAERAAAINSVLADIRSSAATEARNQRLDARADAESILKRRTERQGEAVTQLTALSAGGVTFEGLKQSDKQSFDYFADLFGGEDALKGAFVLNTPADQILDKRIEGGKYIIARQNPITGKITVDTLDLGIPPGYTKTLDAGDRILAMPDNWDGDPSKLITINKGLSPSAASSGSGSGSSNQVIDNERAMFGQFRAEPIVKNYNEVLNKKMSVDAIINNGVGGPADLSIVFEFMKALDPSSVVREAEYESAARSGNIFAGSFAKFNGYFKPEGGFLPQSVREQFQNLVNQKLTVAENLYSNVANQYATIAERQGLNPQNVVLDYAAANSSGSDLKSRAEQQGFDYEAAKAAGYSDEEIAEALQ